MKCFEMDYGYSGEYLLDKIFAMNQHWDNELIINMQSPRLTSSFLYASGCNLEYT